MNSILKVILFPAAVICRQIEIGKYSKAMRKAHRRSKARRYR